MHILLVLSKGAQELVISSQRPTMDNILPQQFLNQSELLSSNNLLSMPSSDIYAFPANGLFSNIQVDVQLPFPPL